MIKNTFLFPVLSLLLMLLLSCSNNDAQNKFEALAYSEPSGITETDYHGEVIRTDSDDWRISPFYLGLAEVDPLFPNPVLYGSTANLEVRINGAPLSSYVELGYLSETNLWIPLQTLDVTSDYEFLVFSIDTRQFGNTGEQARGIYRLLVFDGNQRMISYGDILIE